MAELRFRREDVERLAAKLTEILSGLSAAERRLLVAILAVAADHSYQPVETPGTIEVEELRVQIIQSFVPDGVQEFVLHAKKKPPKIGGPPRMSPEKPE